jgi:hypothetical protein
VAGCRTALPGAADRAHDDDRELYERPKRELVVREWKYVQNYADAPPFQDAL